MVLRRLRSLKMEVTVDGNGQALPNRPARCSVLVVLTSRPGFILDTRRAAARITDID